MLNKKTIFWSVSIIFISILWGFQYLILVNIPLWDDFHGIMLPVFKLFSNAGFIDRLSEFVSLNNEHRIVNDRIFMLVIYCITGTFQMKLLGLLGFINLIVIFALFVKIAKPYVSNLLYLLPITLLLFQPQYFESLQYLMVPFQNFSVICYSLLTFYFLVYTQKNSFVFALIFAILAVFSHGNGFLALLIGILILAYQMKKKHAIIWVAVTIFIMSIYFIGYQKPTWSNDYSFANNPMVAFKYMFEFWGSYILNLTDVSTQLSTGTLKKTISFIFGLSVFLSFFIVILTKYPIYLASRNEYFTKLRHNKVDLFLVSCFAFVVATGILIGISRAGFPMVSRYTINSAVFLSLVYLLLLFNIKHKKRFALITIILTFLIMCISYNNNFEKAIFNKKNVITDGLNWKKTGFWANQYAELSHVKLVNPLLTDIYKAKKYKFPKTELEHYDKLSINAKIQIEKINFEGNYLQIYDKDKNFIDKEIGENGIYYQLKSKSKTFIFPAYHKKNRIDKYLLTGKYYSSDYTTAFPYHLIPEDEYKVLKIINNDGTLTKYATNIVLTKDKKIIRQN